jgi:hypothetical protein
MAKNQDIKRDTKKAPTKTLKESGEEGEEIVKSLSVKAPEEKGLPRQRRILSLSARKGREDAQDIPVF